MQATARMASVVEIEVGVQKTDKPVSVVGFAPTVAWRNSGSGGIMALRQRVGGRVHEGGGASRILRLLKGGREVDSIEG